MKKFLFFSLIALAALTVSCKKDDNKKIDDDATPIEWRGRIDRLADAWDHWDFTYNDNGTIRKVDRDEGDKVWNFDWAGNGTLEAGVSGQDQMNIYRNTDGTISSITLGSDTWTYTYTNGILTEAKKNGTVILTVTVSGGNITKVEEWGEDNTKLEYEYGTEDNPNGFMLHWLDQYITNSYPKWHRFLVEGGLFGKGPAKRPIAVTCNGTRYEYAYEEFATVEGYDVFGWSLPQRGIDIEWGDEAHKYMQIHKD